MPQPTKWMVLAAAALLLGLAAPAQAQVFRCPDGESDSYLYTDQPCEQGALVVPERSPEEIQREAERVLEYRARQVQLREQALAQESLALQAKQARLASTPAPVVTDPSQSANCRAAREEADFRAASRTASLEQIRTARANAALACGQPAPPEEAIYILPEQPVWHGARHRPPYGRTTHRPRPPSVLPPPGSPAWRVMQADVPEQPVLPMR